MGIIMPPKKAPKTKKSSDDKPTKDKPIKKDDVHKKNPGRWVCQGSSPGTKDKELGRQDGWDLGSSTLRTG